MIALLIIPLQISIVFFSSHRFFFTRLLMSLEHNKTHSENFSPITRNSSESPKLALAAYNEEQEEHLNYTPITASRNTSNTTCNTIDSRSPRQWELQRQQLLFTNSRQALVNTSNPNPNHSINMGMGVGGGGGKQTTYMSTTLQTPSFQRTPNSGNPNSDKLGIYTLLGE